jgi:hypothetical protein
VLAQDKDHWKTSTRFHELFAFPAEYQDAVRACTPDFAFRLFQLVDLPYEDIYGTAEGNWVAATSGIRFMASRTTSSLTVEVMPRTLGLTASPRMALT